MTDWRPLPTLAMLLLFTQALAFTARPTPLQQLRSRSASEPAICAAVQMSGVGMPVKTEFAPALAAVLAGNDTLSDSELTCVLLSAAAACQEISRALRVLSLTPTAQAGGEVNVQGEAQKGMDVVANDIFISAMTGHVAAMASEEAETVIEGSAPAGPENV